MYSVLQYYRVHAADSVELSNNFATQSTFRVEANSRLQIRTFCPSDIAADRRGRNEFVAETQAEAHCVSLNRLMKINAIITLFEEKLHCSQM